MSNMAMPENKRCLEFLRQAAAAGASDIHMAPGVPPAMRIDGELHYLTEEPLALTELKAAFALLAPEPLQETFAAEADIDFACSFAGHRLRVNAFRCRGGFSLAIRLIPSVIRNLEDLGYPPALQELSEKAHGLLLITGTTGSGKTTTLAAIVDRINSRQARHIITLEDPIEYIHESKKSIVTQREAGTDFHSFAAALRSAVREDPDVILVGELRDRETVETALSAAETGHFVLGTLHTFAAAEAVLRLESMFPAGQQAQVRMQLSMVLQGIAAQQLLPAVGGGRICAVELLLAVPAVRNLIRDGRAPQLFSQMQMGKAVGMQTMEMAIESLWKNGNISSKTAQVYAQKGNM